MKEQDLTPKYNRLFIKTYISFATVITVFALLLGVLYMRMYEEAAVENYELQQTKKAQAISKRCSTYFLDKQRDEWLSYLMLLSELEGTEIWSISNPDATYPLGADMATSLEADILTKEYVEIAKVAFTNQVEIRTQFSSYHECDTVTIGVPVQGINGEIAGAVLLVSPVETQKEVVNSSWYMIIMSGMVALMISFVIAIEGIEQVFFIVDQRCLGCGGSGIDAQIDRSLGLTDISSANLVLRVALTEGIVFLLIFKQRFAVLRFTHIRSGSIVQTIQNVFDALLRIFFCHHSSPHGYIVL